MPEFPCDGPIDARVNLGSGDVTIVAEDRSTVLVTLEPEHNNETSRAIIDATRVDMTNNALTIEVPSNKGFGFMRRGGSLRITVRLPLDSRIDVSTASADVTATGRLGSSTVKTASGDLRLDEVAGDFVRNSASGDSQINRVRGSLKVDHASGDLRVATIDGDLRLRTASGDANIEAVSGSIKVHSASGDIRIGSISNGETSINSASGDVAVGVAEGTAVWLDVTTLSGDTRSELEMPGGEPAGKPATLKLAVHTVSGDVVIRRAAPITID
jgi:DUF4097 and DUF4098 domain-containing protein YvlB